ncbi:hypothetical protein FRC07_002603 [Ceratobasidium sp. 392]|nr:hypothetical protein FRC07_002603 [Ceratobasidium sp. 392]
MPRKSKKSSVKDEFEREEALRLAVQDVLEHKISQPQAAKRRAVPRVTLQGRLQGRQKYTAAHVHEQALSDLEEAEVVAWCKQMEQQFLPVRLPHIVGCAELILRNRPGVSSVKLGRHLIERFLARHPELKVTTNKRVDERRVMAKNPVNIMEFYVMFSNIVQKYSVTRRRTFNMDEKDYQLGVTGYEKVVIIRRDYHDGYAGGSKHYGNRENITSIDCVCAKGYELPAMIIMKGKHVQQAWLKDSPLDPRTKALQRYCSQAVDARMRKKLAVTKATFGEVLHEARVQAYTEENILSAFEATGLWPLNPYRTRVMQDFLERMRGQQQTPGTSQNDQIAAVERFQDLLSKDDTDPSLLRAALAESIKMIDGSEARAALLEEDLKQLREALKEKTKKKPRNARMGRARVYTQSAVDEIQEKEAARAQGSAKRGRGRGRGRGGKRMSTRNQAQDQPSDSSDDNRAGQKQEGGLDSDFRPESEDSC